MFVNRIGEIVSFELGKVIELGREMEKYFDISRYIICKSKYTQSKLDIFQ